MSLLVAPQLLAACTTMCGLSCGGEGDGDGDEGGLGESASSDVIAMGGDDGNEGRVGRVAGSVRASSIARDATRTETLPDRQE